MVRAIEVGDCEPGGRGRTTDQRPPARPRTAHLTAHCTPMLSRDERTQCSSSIHTCAAPHTRVEQRRANTMFIFHPYTRRAVHAQVKAINVRLPTYEAIAPPSCSFPRAVMPAQSRYDTLVCAIRHFSMRRPASGCCRPHRRRRTCP